MSTQSGKLSNAHVRFVPILVILDMVNIIYAALTSFARRNLKRKIAYPSISHMGFVLIGIASFTDLGLSGAVLQMVSHGLLGRVCFSWWGRRGDREATVAQFTDPVPAEDLLPEGFPGFVNLPETGVSGSFFFQQSRRFPLCRREDFPTIGPQFCPLRQEAIEGFGIPGIIL